MVDPAGLRAAEAQFVAKAVSGDRVALNELLLQHFDSVQLLIARRLATHGFGNASAEDLLQETLVRAIRGIRGFEPREDGTFDGWLRTIAENVLNSQATAVAARKRGGGFRRQRGVKQSGNSSLVDLVELLADAMPHPSSIAARGEMIKAMHVGIAELPDDQRDAVRLRYLRGQDLAQTADTLGRTPAAVRGLLHRAKSRLREALGRSSRWFNQR